MGGGLPLAAKPFENFGQCGFKSALRGGCFIAESQNEQTVGPFAGGVQLYYPLDKSLELLGGLGSLPHKIEKLLLVFPASLFENSKGQVFLGAKMVIESPFAQRHRIEQVAGAGIGITMEGKKGAGGFNYISTSFLALFDSAHYLIL